MYNFRGKLDDKHRMTVPAEIRQELENVIITPGFGSYLHLYPESVFTSEMEAALSSSQIGDGRAAIINEELADLNDKFLAELVATKTDARGRITLDQHLLEYAGLDRAAEWVAVRMPAGG